MKPVIENLFDNLPGESAPEHFLTLLEAGNLRIERIVSNAQASPENSWYEQEQNEWVLLLKGTASLQFENDGVVDLESGDYLLIERHVTHRITQTSQDALWLTV